MKIKMIFAAMILVVVSYLAYNEFAPVKPFLTNEEVATALSIDLKQIDQVYELAENYRYVAYTKNDVPSMSFWKFEDRHWRIINTIHGHEMMLFDIENGDKYYVWNIKGEGMEKLSLYAIHDRGYEVTHNAKGEQVSRYFPQIVLKHDEKIDSTHSYGIFKIPEQWAKAMKRLPQQEQSLFEFYEQPPMFEWEVVDGNGEVVDTVRPNGTSSNGNDDDESQLHFVSQFHHWVEQPVENE